MGRLLFTVEDRFLITGRGLVLGPGIVPQADEQFRIGDPVWLKRPGSSIIPWKIGGLEILNRSHHSRFVVPILVVGLGKEDVPVGTEVWSTDPAEPNLTPTPTETPT